MFFLIFTFFIMLAVNMEGEYSVSSIVLIVSLILILAYIAHIILLTIAVGKSAGKRCMSSDWIWALLTFIFGLPVAIVFAIFIIGIESNKNKKEDSSPAVIALISFTLLAASIIGLIVTGMFTEYYTSSHFSEEYIYYETEDGKQVIYDKMGNAYTREQTKHFKYYDRDGKTYTVIWNYDTFDRDSYLYALKRTENGKEYEYYHYEYDLAIDSDGYVVIFPYDALEYSPIGCLYDENENIYYNPESCYWTPDGKLIFNNEELDEITYQDILDYEEKYAYEDQYDYEAY